MEIWKDIPGYDGLYQVSNLGRVKSLPKKRWNGYVFTSRKERILKPGNDNDGYERVVLCKNKRRKTYKMHRLVITTFVGVSRLEVNHINGNKADNNIENLEYCTRSENMKHAFKTGLLLPKEQKGENNVNATLTDEKVKEIRNLYRGGKYFYRDLAIIYNVGIATISDVINRRTWQHV